MSFVTITHGNVVFPSGGPAAGLTVSPVRSSLWLPLQAFLAVVAIKIEGVSVRLGIAGQGEHSGIAGEGQVDGGIIGIGSQQGAVGQGVKQGTDGIGEDC